MGAIAYITDSKMLELHRLNAHSTMNFWRLSSKTNFRDFDIGDLVFFLSKDKAHKKKNEKGIVGFGRLEAIHQSSIRTMWKNFGIYNGYNTLEEFTKAISRVNKAEELPKKISSLYLVNVSFFQAPIYLSECGMEISSNVESYIYLKPEEIALKILDYAKDYQDLWTSSADHASSIEEEKLIYALNLSHKRIGDMQAKDTTLRKAKTVLKKEEGYHLLQHSRTEAYRLDGDTLEILFYHDRDIDTRMLLGQRDLYRHYLKEFYQDDLNIRFSTSDRDAQMERLLNQ